MKVKVTEEPVVNCQCCSRNWQSAVREKEVKVTQESQSATREKERERDEWGVGVIGHAETGSHPSDNKR